MPEIDLIVVDGLSTADPSLTSRLTQVSLRGQDRTEEKSSTTKVKYGHIKFRHTFATCSLAETPNDTPVSHHSLTLVPTKVKVKKLPTPH